MNERDQDQFFGQFTVMFLIIWSIYCDVSNCDCNRAVETHFKKPRFFRFFLKKTKKPEKLGF